MDLAALDRTQQGFGDGKLLANMRAGYPAAFATLMRSNNQRLYRLAPQLSQGRGGGRGCASESHVPAFTHLDRFRDK